MKKAKPAGHHYYATTAFSWFTATTREKAIATVVKKSGIKGPLYVWSVRVEIPQKSSYKIENYRPVGVPLTESIDGDYLLVAGKPYRVEAVSDSLVKEGK